MDMIVAARFQPFAVDKCFGNCRQRRGIYVVGAVNRLISLLGVLDHLLGSSCRFDSKKDSKK
jgi:hypothetical protein